MGEQARRRATYTDLLTLPEDAYVELIKGCTTSGLRPVAAWDVQDSVLTGKDTSAKRFQGSLR